MSFRKKASLKKNLVVFLFATLLITSCKQIDIFEKNTTISNQKWAADFTVKDSFFIATKNSNYNVYVVIRHTDAYQYNNIWLNVGLQQQGDSMKMQKINIKLGSDAQGWEGAGMNDIWEVREPIAIAIPLKNGAYKYTIGQIMRDNPLLSIMSVGLRVEKAL